MANNDPNLIDDEKTGDIDVAALRTALKRRSSLWTTFTMAVGTLVAMLLSVSGLFLTTEKRDVVRVPMTYQDDEIRELKMEVASLREIVKITPKAPSSSQLEMSKRLETLNRKIEMYEKTMGSDPEKLLAIPILRKDMELAEVKMRNALDIISKDVERIDSYFKILFASIGSAVIAMLSYVLQNDSVRKSILDAITKSSKS
ncbi:hypothetical protein [Bdellovibrio sp. HCB2-146]|uniref:hypothetical protein n=1 Tax=Bdellovibrio sp. HCB2-146 TaxID=3394362 RepID=UPI0039BC230A